MQTTSGPENN